MLVNKVPLRRATFSFSFSNRLFHSSAVSSSLTLTTFLTVLARLPNSSVDLVSDSLKLAGEQQMTMVVRALPPRDSCRIRVSLESRYGM